MDVRPFSELHSQSVVHKERAAHADTAAPARHGEDDEFCLECRRREILVLLWGGNVAVRECGDVEFIARRVGNAGDVALVADIETFARHIPA